MKDREEDDAQERRREHARLARLIADRRDTAAFAVLFDHYAPRINAYLRTLGLDAGTAEDMAQDVMAVLWHKAHLFNPALSSLATWLFRVARNRRIDGVRRDRAHLVDLSDPMLLPEAPESAERTIDAERRDERVRAAVAALPDNQAELLRYAYFLGLTQTQIAERTGLPLGTVKSRVRLAFGRLKAALQADSQVDTED